MGHTRSLIMLAGGSGTSSTYTSNPFLISDARIVAVSYVTGVAVASKLTIDASLNDQAPSTTALAGWSNLTIATVQGIYSVTPGPRWIRVVRGAVDSMSTIVLAYRNDMW